MSPFIFIKTDENELQDVALLFWRDSLRVQASEALKGANRLQHGHIRLCHRCLDKPELFAPPPQDTLKLWQPSSSG